MDYTAIFKGFLQIIASSHLRTKRSGIPSKLSKVEKVMRCTITMIWSINPNIPKQSNIRFKLNWRYPTMIMNPAYHHGPQRPFQKPFCGTSKGRNPPHHQCFEGLFLADGIGNDWKKWWNWRCFIEGCLNGYFGEWPLEFWQKHPSAPFPPGTCTPQHPAAFCFYLWLERHRGKRSMKPTELSENSAIEHHPFCDWRLCYVIYLYTCYG